MPTKLITAVVRDALTESRTALDSILDTVADIESEARTFITDTRVAAQDTVTATKNDAKKFATTTRAQAKTFVDASSSDVVGYGDEVRDDLEGLGTDLRKTAIGAVATVRGRASDVARDALRGVRTNTAKISGTTRSDEIAELKAVVAELSSAVKAMSGTPAAKK